MTTHTLAGLHKVAEAREATLMEALTSVYGDQAHVMREQRRLPSYLAVLRMDANKAWDMWLEACVNEGGSDEAAARYIRVRQDEEDAHG